MQNNGVQTQAWLRLTHLNMDLNTRCEQVCVARKRNAQENAKTPKKSRVRTWTQSRVHALTHAVWIGGYTEVNFGKRFGERKNKYFTGIKTYKTSADDPGKDR